MSAPANFIDFIDNSADKFIQRLADAVAIPRSVEAYSTFVDLSFLPSFCISSISGDASRRGDVVKMALFLDNQLKSYGVETKLVELGEHTLEGQRLKLPPAILGKIGSDPRKKTVLIYGHFDVQPVSLHAVDLMWCDSARLLCLLETSNYQLTNILTILILKATCGSSILFFVVDLQTICQNIWQLLHVMKSSMLSQAACPTYIQILPKADGVLELDFHFHD